MRRALPSRAVRLDPSHPPRQGDAAGLGKLGCVALGHTKVKADASKHDVMGYVRREQAEKQIKAEVNALVEWAV